MTFKQKIIIALGLVATGVIARLVPHLWNMTPIAAVAVLAGAKLGWKWGVILPILAMITSDVFIGFYNLPVLLSVYLCFALTGLVGYSVRKTGKVGVVLGGSALSAIVFFLVTNAAVWAFSPMYPQTFMGLTASYIAGLPFFQNQIIGDLFFTTALFAAWELTTYVAKHFQIGYRAENVA